MKEKAVINKALPCKKRKFDKVSAMYALSQIEYHKDIGVTDKKEKRAYKCNLCSNWHLTSKDLKTENMVNRRNK